MRFIFTPIFVFLTIYTVAQRCGTSEYSKTNSASRLFGTIANSPKSGRDTLKDEVIVIPVIVHVLFNNGDQNISDQQVLSQIEVLNNDYRRMNADTANTPLPFKNVAADTRIAFCLSKVDPQGNYTTGIIHKYTKESVFLSDDKMKFTKSGGDDAWDATKYLNIWVCNLFGRTLGYSVLPGGAVNKDGVVIKYNAFGTIGAVSAPYNKGRTATHEIGHWLGLRHIWGDNTCGDDGIADTPPQQASNRYCPVFPHLSACSVNGYGDMFMNFMDFTDDGCMNLFTQGQKSEMRSLFAAGHARNSFLNSSVCDSANAQAAPLPIVTRNESPVISTYPNPFINEINIVSQNGTSLVGKILKLYDVTGRLFVMQILQSQKTVLQVSNLPHGIYFLKVDGGKDPLIYKMVK